MKKISHHRVSGLTLIELLITLVVLAIILALAAPSFKTQMVNSRAAATGETLANTLSFARSEALKRKARVTVCGSDNGIGCNSSNWADGVLVVLDLAVNDTAAAPVVGEVLRVVTAFDSGTNISVSNGKNFVRYLASGATARVDNNPFSVQMYVEGCTGHVAQKLSISLSGAISIEKNACPTGG